MYYQEAIELDLLPFGDIEEADRHVRLTDSRFVLNMPGFKEIYPSVADVPVTDDLSIKVCTMEGIILLKLISNNDRPERTKDISDIEHIIRVYFNLYDGDIYKEHFDTMKIYGTDQQDYLQLVCARVIGRKIKALLVGSDGIGRWAIEEKETGNFVGWAGLKLITDSVNGYTNYFDLGYRLIRKHWGKGYASEAATTCVTYGFNSLMLSEIYAIANVGNTASVKILERTGFKRIQSFEFQNEQHYWFKLRKDEWSFSALPH